MSSTIALPERIADHHVGMGQDRILLQFIGQIQHEQRRVPLLFPTTGIRACGHMEASGRNRSMAGLDRSWRTSSVSNTAKAVCAWLANEDRPTTRGEQRDTQEEARYGGVGVSESRHGKWIGKMGGRVH